MNLIEINYTKLSILYKRFREKAILFFYRLKQNENPYAKIVEDLS